MTTRQVTLKFPKRGPGRNAPPSIGQWSVVSGQGSGIRDQGWWSVVSGRYEDDGFQAAKRRKSSSPVRDSPGRGYKNIRSPVKGERGFLSRLQRVLFKTTSPGADEPVSKLSPDSELAEGEAVRRLCARLGVPRPGAVFVSESRRALPVEPTNSGPVSIPIQRRRQAAVLTTSQSRRRV